MASEAWPFSPGVIVSFMEHADAEASPAVQTFAVNFTPRLDGHASLAMTAGCVA
jgi:hypothetical protein